MTELERGSNRDLAPHLVLLAIVVLWSSWAASCFFLNEDAFISFRYVQNLVQGHGLVYNPGVYDEGYSNLLWILLLAPFALAGIPPEHAAPALGILSGALLLYVVWRLAKRSLPDSRWLPLAAPGLAAASFSLVFWAGSGMETVFFGLLLACAVYFHLRERPSRFPWTGLFLGLAALTRPEGFGFILVFASHYLYCRWRKNPVGSDWRDLIPALGLLAAQFVFRRLYYGMWWSLPAIVKAGGSFTHLKAGLLYLLDWSILYPPLILGGLGLYGLIRHWRKKDASLLAMILIGQFVFIIYSGGDYLPHFRFLVTVLAPLVLLAVLGIGELKVVLKKTLRFLVPAFIGGVILWNLVLSISPTLDFWGRSPDMMHQNRKIMAGKWLRDALPPGTLIASGSAGALPYSSGLPSLDFAGLCNAEAALEGEKNVEGMVGHFIAHPGLIIRDKPWVVVLYPSASPMVDVLGWLEGKYAVPGYTFKRLSYPNQSVLSDPCFAEMYQPMMVRTAPDLYFTFYALKGEAVERCLAAGAMVVSPIKPKGM
jgi:arabinofuranosyltransferase